VWPSHALTCWYWCWLHLHLHFHSTVQHFLPPPKKLIPPLQGMAYASPASLPPSKHQDPLE